MKRIILLFFIVITFANCERDDICIDDITPHLIIRFYDIDNPAALKTVDIGVQVLGIDGNYTHSTITTATDSILIPLNVNQNLSQFVLSSNNSSTTNNNPDTISLNYTRDDIFVGRSCGFKTVFKDISISKNDDSNNWIQSIQTVETPQNIENETSAHVKIFH